MHLSEIFAIFVSVLYQMCVYKHFWWISTFYCADSILLVSYSCVLIGNSLYVLHNFIVLYFCDISNLFCHVTNFHFISEHCRRFFESQNVFGPWSTELPWSIKVTCMQNELDDNCHFIL